MVRPRLLISDLLTASPAADIGHLISSNVRQTVKTSVFATQPGWCCWLTWPAHGASCPSSLLRPTSERSVSTSALRASSWYRDTTERNEELTAASVSRRTGQGSLLSSALCPLPASKTALTGPMQPTEGGLRWQHDRPGILRQTGGCWFLPLPTELLYLSLSSPNSLPVAYEKKNYRRVKKKKWQQLPLSTVPLC